MTTKEEFERRIEEARKIKGLYMRDTTLCEIISELADAGIFAEAIKTMQDLSCCFRDDATIKIAVALARAGQFEEAIEIARKIIRREELLCSIACEQARAGIDARPLFGEAIEIARKEGTKSKVRMLSDIACEQARAGIDARPLFAEALRTAQEFDQEDWLARADELTHLARQQAESSLPEDALETAKEIVLPEIVRPSDAPAELIAAGMALELSVVEHKADVLLKIACMLAKELRLQKAKDGEFQRPDFKKTISGQPSAEKAKEKR